MMDIETWRDLRDYLNQIKEEELDQPCQAVKPHPMSEKVMFPAIAIGTMDEMEFDSARSITDNKFHPEQIVLLLDLSPWGQDGATSYHLQTGEAGEHTFIPIYGKDGPTAKKDQMNPKFDPLSDDFEEEHNLLILQHRVKKIQE